MSRYNTTRTQGGGVIQAGLDIQQRGPSHTTFDPTGLHRGIVLETFAPKTGPGTADEDFNEDNFRRFQVECTVLLAKTQIFLRQVPVKQPFYGVNNANPWVPRPTTRVLSESRDLNFRPRTARGQFVSAVPALDDLDGDMVIVEFLDNEIDSPMITGAITHEQTNRRIIKDGTGWTEGTAAAQRGHPEQFEYFLHHKGCEVRINDDGEFLIDTVGAYTDPKTESAGTSKGDVRIRVKDTQRLIIAMGDDEDVLEVFKDGSQLRIDLGKGAAERLVLGDAFLAFINNFFSTEFALHQHLPGTYVGASAVTGQSGAVAPADIPPTVPPPAFLTISMPTSQLSDLSKTKK